MREEDAKTFIPIILGAIAGAISYMITGANRSRDPLGIIVLVLFIYVNKFIMPKIGVRLESRDWASITFLTFASWYVLWTFLLNLPRA